MPKFLQFIVTKSSFAKTLCIVFWTKEKQQYCYNI
jgi:hypothetical protein